MIAVSSEIPPDRYYKLADFLGISLRIESGKVTGKQQLNVDFGLFKTPLVVQIFDSFVDMTTGRLALLIATPRDLGLGVAYDAASKEVDVFVLDREMLPARGVRFFSEPECAAFIDAYERLKNSKPKAHLRGIISRVGGFKQLAK